MLYWKRLKMNSLLISFELIFIISAGQSPNNSPDQNGFTISMRIARGICNDNILFAGSKKIQPPSTSWRGISTVKPGRPCQAVRWNRWQHCGSARNCPKSKFKLIQCSREHIKDFHTTSRSTEGDRGKGRYAFMNPPQEKSNSEIDANIHQGYGRAIGGNAATVDDVPYIAGVYLNKQRICAGSILNPNYILTLASCYRGKNINPSQLEVIAGDPRLQFNDKSEKVLFVSKLILHQNVSNNIALIQLEFPAPVNNAIQQIILPDADAIPTGNVIISGWGALNPTGGNDLRFGDGDIMQPLNCRNVNETKNVTENEICLFPGEVAICDSDAGGPIIQMQLDNTFTLVGIIQSGEQCGLTSVPSVGVRVSAFIPWIYENITPHFKQISSKILIRLPALKPNKLVYAVRLVKHGQTLCGGSLINEFSVVTAASCLYNETVSAKNIQVIAGDYNVNVNEATEQVRIPWQFIIHPQYDPVLNYHDIAVIIVREKFIFDSVKVAPLFVFIPVANILKPLTLGGWASIAQNASNAHHLQIEIPMRNISFEECLQKYNNTVKKLEDNIICGMPSGTNGYSTCRSDYGSALVAESNPNFYTIFGVASFRIGCDDSAYPMIFTDAQAHKNFIDHQLDGSTASILVNQFDLPFFVFVNSPVFLPCGGVILNERFIVTAAQCVASVSPGEEHQVKVYGGKISLHAKGQNERQLVVSSVHVHKGFDPVTLEHDIALLEVQSPIPFNNEIQPGNLAETQIFQSNIQEGVIVGYGLDHLTHKGHLQSLKVNLISNYACRQEYAAVGSSLSIDKGKICTVSHMFGNCVGDPGAPLFEYEFPVGPCRNIIGLLSHQSDCKTAEGDTYLPSVYTDVAYYHKWVEETIKGIVFMDGQRNSGDRRQARQGFKSPEQSQSFQRSFGSDKAILNEFPHQAQMVLRGEHICSGAILDALHVVTTAECATKLIPGISFVRAGTDNQGNPVQQRAIVNILVHEDFDSISRLNDIAVLTCGAPWLFDNVKVKPIAYSPNYTVLPGTVGSMSSWGYGFVDEQYLPNVLQKLTFTAPFFGRCFDVYGCGFINIAGLFCVEVAGNNRAGICEGDQGSPLVVEHDGKQLLVGLASFRSGCSAPNYPSVFTSTSFHYTWIETHLFVEPDISVAPNEFPFQAAIMYKFAPLCCCTILSTMHILIPSRCLVDGNENLVSDWSVYAGNDNLTPGLQAQTRQIKKLIKNDTNPTTKADDFAIAILFIPLILDAFVQAAIVPPPSYANVNELIVNSWQLRPGYQLVQKLFANAVDNSFCQKPYENEQNITGVLFCSVFSAAKFQTSVDLAGGPMSEKQGNGCHVIMASPVATCFTDPIFRPCIFNNMVKHGDWIYHIMGETLREIYVPDAEATPNEFKFLIRIIKGGSATINETLCSGVLVSSKIVLSVASCFTNVEEEELTVISAEVNYDKWDSGEENRTVTAILVHEDYNDITRANNIALLLLTSAIRPQRQVQFASLATPESNFIIPNTLTLAGFRHSKGTGIVAKSTVRLQTLNKCTTDYICSRYPVGERVRCGVTSGGFGSGYEGGPLLINDPNEPTQTIFGLNSFRHGCSATECTRVFTDLVPHADWILNKPAGGQRVSENKFDFHVIVILPDGLHCSGSLIGHFHILTTMSCIFNYQNRAEEIRIVAGVLEYDAFNPSPSRQVRRGVKIYFNRNYTGENTKINDVALLEVANSFKRSPTLGFVMLPEKPFVAEGQVDIAGWYFTENSKVTHMREINMTVLDLPTCEDGFGKEGSKTVINDRMICTFFNAPSFCFGELGSPMTQVKSGTCRTLVGMASTNFDCGNIKFPSIYSNVSSNLDYVLNNIPKDKPLAKHC